MQGFGIADADTSADPDLDGLDNWSEYLLGGNPNIDDAATVLPTSAMKGGTIEYVYTRRKDAILRGLAYGLNETDSLTNSWSPASYETGSAATSPYYESVTNEIPTAGKSKGFYRLEIVAE